MRFYYKQAYLKAFDKLPHLEQALALKTDRLIKGYLSTSKASLGLRVKQLRGDIFEGRINDRLRIVWVKDRDEITFALLGNHEEVRRFLKRI
jgi:hypothetical protein